MPTVRLIRAIIICTCLCQLPSLAAGASTINAAPKPLLSTSSRLNTALFTKSELTFNTQNYGKYFAQLELSNRKAPLTPSAISRRLSSTNSVTVQGGLRVGGYISPHNKIYMGLGFQDARPAIPTPPIPGFSSYSSATPAAVAPRIGFEHQFLHRWSISSELQTHFTPSFSTSLTPRKPRLQGKAVLLNLKYSFE